MYEGSSSPNIGQADSKQYSIGDVDIHTYNKSVRQICQGGGWCLTKLMIIVCISSRKTNKIYNSSNGPNNCKDLIIGKCVTNNVSVLGNPYQVQHPQDDGPSFQVHADATEGDCGKSHPMC